MKNIAKLLAIFFGLSAALTLWGNDCVTLQLREKAPQQVQIEEMGTEYLRYRPCGAGKRSTRKVGWYQVSDLSDNGAGVLPGLRPVSTASKKKKEDRIKWVFKHKYKKKTRTLTQGDWLTLEHIDAGFLRKSKGTLNAIDDSTVYILNEYGYMFSVPRDKVTNIKRHRKGGGAGKALGAVAIAGGIILTILAVIAAILAAAVMLMLLLLFPFTAGEGGDEGPGCTLPILLILGGVGIFALSMPKSIKDPFGPEWEVRMETPAAPNQSDAGSADGISAP